MTEESKNVQTTQPAPTASAIGPCPTIIQIVGRPGTGSLPRTIAPSDHPLLRIGVKRWRSPDNDVYECRNLKHAYIRVKVRILTAAQRHERRTVTEAPFKTLVKVQWAIQGWARHALSRKRLMRKGRHGLLGAPELKAARTHGVTETETEIINVDIGYHCPL